MGILSINFNFLKTGDETSYKHPIYYFQFYPNPKVLNYEINYMEILKPLDHLFHIFNKVNLVLCKNLCTIDICLLHLLLE